MSYNNQERRPNRGVLFTHKKGKHVDLLYDGSVEVDIDTVCRCEKCGHVNRFKALGSFFLNLWRPKSEKVSFNVSLSQKGSPEHAADTGPRAPDRPSNQYSSQAPMNYGGGHQKAQAPRNREIDDEIPF